MTQQGEAAPVEGVAEGSLVCRHHWLIQAADGPSSAGVCRICGETREFKNYMETAAWGDSRLYPAPVPVSREVILATTGDGWDDE